MEIQSFDNTQKTKNFGNTKQILITIVKVTAIAVAIIAVVFSICMLITFIPFIAEALTVLALQLAIPAIALQILISSTLSVVAIAIYLFITILYLNFSKNTLKNKSTNIPKQNYNQNPLPKSNEKPSSPLSDKPPNTINPDTTIIKTNDIPTFHPVPAEENDDIPPFQKLLDFGEGGCSELIVMILRFLNPLEIQNISLTCKQFKNIVDKQKIIWINYLKIKGTEISKSKRKKYKNSDLMKAAIHTEQYDFGDIFEKLKKEENELKRLENELKDLEQKLNPNLFSEEEINENKEKIKNIKNQISIQKNVIAQIQI